MAIFSKSEMEQAVAVQRRSYLLLQWMADAVGKGIITFDTAHDYADLPSAAEGWILRHYEDIPPVSRPEKANIRAFANYFSTFLTSSFDLIENPGQRLYSEDAHCFCPMCSYLVDRGNLRTKKVRPRDKRDADRCERKWLDQLAASEGLHLRDEQALEILASDELREALALGAYGIEIQRRLRGATYGRAALALWRRFAWNQFGSPKKNFKLSSSLLMSAERIVLAQLVSVISRDAES